MKRWKEVLFMVPTLAVGIAVTMGIWMNKPEFPEITYPERQKEEVREKSEPEQTESPDDSKNAIVKKTVTKKTSKKAAPVKVSSGEPKDGTYTGTAVCEQFGYYVSLTASFKDGKVTALYDLKITNNSDPANKIYWEKAWKPVVKQILASQSGNVDVVSGATYSSNAIVAAYLNAREKAISPNRSEASSKNVVPAAKKVEKAKKKVLDEPATKKPKGEIVDGTYHVSSQCKPDQSKAFASYRLSADVVFKEGKLKAFQNFSSTAESNRSYYLKAANGSQKNKGVVTQLLAKQSAVGISAVSGATCSSKTIRDLYLLALAKATGTKQEPSSSDELITPPEEEKPDEGSKEPDVTLPVEDNSDVKDGIYTVTVTVWPDEWEEFMEYTLTAKVTFLAGKLISIDEIEISDESNMGYCTIAANGVGTKQGVISQLISTQNSNVDVVSGATCSSEALIELYRNAVAMAREGDSE